ncbi:MAG: alanine:cation symporter family protein, partial [Planctomycetaceae bacterium]|nr:alanine:cation symporter family protein [Planctomycetaceae bacterium]
MSFINIRAFKHAIDLTRGLYDKPGETGEVSHFQALSAALSATVGLGNIAGVAIAIGTGGPGACLWIIAIGLLGMSAKFAECTLGQLYRTKDEDGHVLGGPMRYLQVGLSDINMAPLGKFLAILFMLLCVGASFGGGNAFQIGQSLEAIRGDVPILQDFPVIYGVIMAGLVGIVIVGGMRSIGAVASKIVPFMCGAYVLAALFILANNIADIPAAISLIWSEAFEPNAMYGGFLGVLVIGVKRAVFSNEAGVGSAAIAHSAAKTDEP